MRLALVPGRKRPFNFELEHSVVCAATGACTCTRNKVQFSSEVDGRMVVRTREQPLGKAVTLFPGQVSDDLPAAVTKILRVKNALAEGLIRQV